MSVHASYRFKRSYQAVLFTLIAMSGNAFALTLGLPTIQSEQHEPLSATIPVSNINANDFNASIAPVGVYQQMGMTASNVQVRFVKTSDTTGNLVLSSSAPVSTPFADVVLALSDSGQEHLKPQTLLLPISTKNTRPTTVAAVTTQPELPLVSGQPLVVNNVAPPPLEEPSQQVGNAISLPKSSSETADSKATRSNANDTHIASTNENTNAQLDILTKQVTTQVVGVVGADTATVAENVAATDTTVSSNISDPALVSEDTADSGASYVVQSGDSLWKIAEQIAKANDLSVPVVMKALHEKNPHAFSNGNVNQLKAKVALAIPDYDVVPSQKAIQEAIAVRQTLSNAKKSKTKTVSTPVKPTRPTQAKANQSGKSKTTVQPLPKPQVTLVTPNKSGQATGTSQIAGAGHGDPLVSSLKNTRAQLAKKAKKVNNLNQELSSATQKLQLQNQKLAELEARLKALKDK